MCDLQKMELKKALEKCAVSEILVPFMSRPILKGDIKCNKILQSKRSSYKLFNYGI